MAKKPRTRRRLAITVIEQEAEKFGFTAPDLPKKGERFISPNEAGRILNVTGEAVKQWIYHRHLPAVKLSNGYWKIKIADLESFMAVRLNPVCRRVLIIERPGKFLEEATTQIKTEGFEVVVANNPTDALLKAADLVPSLFIINVSIEGGWGLVEKVRSSRNVRRLPILIISDAALTPDKLEMALNLDVQGVLQKSSADDLAKEIKIQLSRVM